MKKLYPLLFKDKKGEEAQFSSSCRENSIISNGFLNGNTLDDVIDTYLGNLLGDKVFNYFRGSLPYQVKIIKDNKEGNVIVSPSDTTAWQRWNCWGKERVIYILKSAKDSTLYLGFRKDISAKELYELMLNGNIKSALNQIEPEAGELFYIPAEIPFAIGKGIEYIEIGQNSPIDMNIEDEELFAEALDFLNLNSHTPDYSIPEDNILKIEVLDIEANEQKNIAVNETESFMYIISLTGELIVNSGMNEIRMGKNEVTLIPHEISDISISSQSQSCKILKVSLDGVPKIIDE